MSEVGGGERLGVGGDPGKPENACSVRSSFSAPAHGFLEIASLLLKRIIAVDRASDFFFFKY